MLHLGRVERLDEAALRDHGCEARAAGTFEDGEFVARAEGVADGDAAAHACFLARLVG